MRTLSPDRRRALAVAFLCLCVLLAQSAPAALARQSGQTVVTTPAPAGAVEVRIGKPSVWTLAQAHYLIAKLHEDDRALKLATLADLNPNAVNRNLFEMLKVFFGASAEFDQTAGLRNDLLRQRVLTNSGRQQSLKTELDQRNNEQIQLTRDIAQIDVELAKLNAATPKDDNAISIQQATKAGKEAEKSLVNSRITALNTELSGLASEDIGQKIPSFGGPFSATPAATPIPPALQQLIDKPFLDNVFKTQNSPQLQASMQLDNHIQMQYELIAKQLTLLRDEVGPDERVIFLELPSSIYTVPKRADGHVVQVRWDVTQYLTRPDSQQPPPKPCLNIGVAGDSNAQFTRILADSNILTVKESPAGSKGAEKWEDAGGSGKLIRTVDIIPRQSALNVNQVHETSRGFALSAKFLAVFGFGAKVDYQRQREVYDQFIYQDIFASGYGKGESSFGWTFGPLPGTKRIAPGIRTTYAVLVVPRAAKGLRVAATGYAFDMRSAQPGASGAALVRQSFELEIPDDAANGFDMDGPQSGAQYTSVRSDERVTLTLSGQYFSPQVNVLVNGVPLSRKVSLQPPASNEPGTGGGGGGGAGASGISGAYEYVNSKKIIATFSMSSGYEGTPTITLVTPQRTQDINRIDMDVNNSKWACDSLQVHSLLEPMFRSTLAVSKLDVVRRIYDGRGESTYVKAILSGTGFRPDAIISVNGVTVSPGNVVQRSTHQFDLVFPDPKVPSWTITVRQNTTRGLEEASLPLTRPFAPSITSEILRYTPAAGKKPARLTLRLTASGAHEIAHVDVVGDDSATVVQTDHFATGDMLVTLNMQKEFGGEPVLLRVIGDKGDASIVSLLPPLPPTVRGVVNDAAQGKSEGPTDGGYVVLIKGERLDRVERVYFGTKPAQIQQSSPEVLTVLVPKGEEGTVRVLLETNILYQGRLLSNSADFGDPNRSLFTYIKKAQ